MPRVPVFNVQEVHELFNNLLDRDAKINTGSANIPYKISKFIFRNDSGGLHLIIARKISKTDIEIEFYFWVEKYQFFNFAAKVRKFDTIKKECDSSGIQINVRPLFPYDMSLINESQIRRAYEATTYQLFFVAFFLTIMNCKNINYIDYDPNSGIPWRNQKNGKKKPKPPYVQYKILEIQPMKQKTQTRGKPAMEKKEERLHTVRGHFKTFTPEHPLFGKYAGTYWWGDCIKGNAEFGLTEKDYHIKIGSDVFDRVEKAPRNSVLTL